MPNIMDYLDWRGDIPFSVDPFNEVDNLILAELAYVDFGGIVPSAEEENGMASFEGIPVFDVCRRFWELHTPEEIENSGTAFRRAPFLLEKLCSGARFGNMRLAGYVNRISPEEEEQMSAVTCILEDTDAYVSFRGTDNTVVGWKEDFTFCFRRGTQGQWNAAEYLSRYFADWPGSLRVGGHSKGGNFAVFAAAFCDDGVKERITDVYTNDGPGFLKEVIETEEYREILPRIHSFIPEESLFGLLLETGYPRTVVKSSRRGIWQHDALSWNVRRNSFETAPDISEGSIVAEKALENWISGMPMEERREFVDALFSLFDESGVENLNVIAGAQFRSASELFHAYREKSPAERQLLRRAVGSLLRSGMNALTENLAENFQSFREYPHKEGDPGHQ